MEQPQGDSEAGLLERLGNVLVPEAPADEAVEASQEAVADDEQPAEAQAPEDDGFVELEMDDGETVRVPPKLKDGYLRHSDYTKKTQDLATLQRNAQAALQQQAQVAQFQEQTREDSQKLAEVQAELKRLKGIDWTGLDADTIWKTRAYVDNLKDQATDLERSIGQKQQAFRQQLAQTRAQASQSAYEFIGRHVKDWKPDSQTEREVAAYVGNYGIQPETLADIAVLFPGFAVLAAKAASYDKLRAATGPATQKAQKAAPMVKPGAAQSTKTVQQATVAKAKARLQKTGSLNDAAALILQRMK